MATKTPLKEKTFGTITEPKKWFHWWECEIIGLCSVRGKTKGLAKKNAQEILRRYEEGGPLDLHFDGAARDKAEVCRIDNFNVTSRKFLLTIQNGTFIRKADMEKVKEIITQHGASIERTIRGTRPQRKAGVSVQDISPKNITLVIRAKGSQLVQEPKGMGFPYLVNSGGLISEIDKAIYNRKDELLGVVHSLNGRLVEIRNERASITITLKKAIAELKTL